MNPFFSKNKIIYVIETPMELVNLNQLFKENSDKAGIVFIANDIDMTGYEYTPPGSLEQPFKWHIDGGMNSISNLSIQMYNKHFGGLIAYAKCNITNLILQNVQVEARSYAGSLVGFAIDSNIENVFVNKCQISSRLFAGGLMGGCLRTKLNVIKLDVTSSILHSTSEKEALLISQVGPGTTISNIEISVNPLQKVKLAVNVLNSFEPPSFSNIVIKEKSS